MMNRIRFTKMHGCGNDYIYVNTKCFPVEDPNALAIRWSDRHKGIGSDGLVLIGESPVVDADFSMRIFNADGSEAMMCGNASRCIGKYVFERGLTHKTEIRLWTASGVKVLTLHVVADRVESVTVDMEEPKLVVPEQFQSSPDLPLGTFVSMGNPHYVIFTKDVDQVGVKGPELEHHPAFPQRCNIEFARVVSPCSMGSDKVRIRTRVWERGSGITQACGTGACATTVAACITGHASRNCSIEMDGGTLDIEWRRSDNHLYMTGPAAFVFDGEIEI